MREGTQRPSPSKINVALTRHSTANNALSIWHGVNEMFLYTVKQSAFCTLFINGCFPSHGSQSDWEGRSQTNIHFKTILGVSNMGSNAKTSRKPINAKVQMISSFMLVRLYALIGLGTHAALTN